MSYIREVVALVLTALALLAAASVALVAGALDRALDA